MITPAPEKWSLAEARHLLNRAGFGGSPEEIAKLHRRGRAGAVDFLLKPEEKIAAFPLPEWSEMEVAMAERREYAMAKAKFRRETKGMSPEEMEKAKRMARKETRNDAKGQALEAQGWWFRRILKTEAPLREKMTLFWHDHFATSIQKTKFPALMIQQNDLFRRNASGNFRELTQKVVEDPAMMLYLDIQKSSKEQPNENFAREVMELFTLGEGNYTEQDVKEAARAFTGYSMDKATGVAGFSERRWDSGVKEIFGKRGNLKGADVIGLIFEQPACAEHMARKLWEFFAYEKPPELAVKALAASLRKADYEVEPILREIFLSGEFYEEKAVGTMIKSPVQFLVQMLKELEMEEPPVGLPITAQAQLGQVLFMPPNVAGWDWGQAWINTNTLLTRYNLAGTLTKGSFDEGKEKPGMGGKLRQKLGKNRGMRGNGGVEPEFAEIVPTGERKDLGKLVDALDARFFSIPVPKKARDSFFQYAEAKKEAGLSDKELGELCHLMMSTPYYQLM